MFARPQRRDILPMYVCNNTPTTFLFATIARLPEFCAVFKLALRTRGQIKIEVTVFIACVIIGSTSNNSRLISPTLAVSYYLTTCGSYLTQSYRVVKSSKVSELKILCISYEHEVYSGGGLCTGIWLYGSGLDGYSSNSGTVNFYSWYYYVCSSCSN